MPLFSCGERLVSDLRVGDEYKIPATLFTDHPVAFGKETTVVVNGFETIDGDEYVWAYSPVFHTSIPVAPMFFG